jgi:formylglycine-generating enzyme required for sulfatase activity
VKTEEEKSSLETEKLARFDVELLTTGDNKVQLDQLLRRVRGLSASPEEILDSCPCTIAVNISGVAAKKLQVYLEQIGVKVLIRKHGYPLRPPIVYPSQKPDTAHKHMVTLRSAHPHDTRTTPPIAHPEVMPAVRADLPQLSVQMKQEGYNHAAVERQRSTQADPLTSPLSTTPNIRLKRSVGELTKALTDKDWTIREHAIIELGQVPSNGIVRYLTVMLKDDVWRVRCTALDVLGKIGAEVALKDMASCVQDDVWHVRYQAIGALSRIESDKVLKPIITALHDTNWQVRQRAVQVLGNIRSNHALDSVITCLKDEVWHVRESAAEALAHIKSEKSIKALTESLRDSNWRVRSMAITALKEIGSERAINALIDALNDDTWIVHWKAAYALGKIGNTALFPVLCKLGQENNPVLREASKKVLQSLEMVVEPKRQALPRLEYRSEDPSVSMIFIPAGNFLMGDDNGHDDAKPARQVFVPEFFMDAYEVTNAQYKRFNPSHDYPHNMGSYPVVNITWEEAQAYAEWIGKRLPTEAEWEKAARGTEGRLYPWGDTFDPAKCNTEESEIRRLTRVEQYPDNKSPYGVCDMFGNVLEWTADQYKPYQGSSYLSPDFQEAFIVLRGSSWIHQGNRSNCATRNYAPVGNKSNFIGFRCAKDLK